MLKTVFREIGAVRRSPVPRKSVRRTVGTVSGFDGLLARLTGASNKLSHSRSRAKR